MEFLTQYRWPGNARELRNVIEPAMILEDKTELLPKDLPPDLRSGGLPDHKAVPISLPNEGVSMEEVERSLIIRALEASHGNQSRAAKFLKMSRDTLRYRMKKFGIGRTQVDAESNA
jgi:two-component system NtrC family response regulator